jgi:hypothetical protein
VVRRNSFSGAWLTSSTKSVYSTCTESFAQGLVTSVPWRVVLVVVKVCTPLLCILWSASFLHVHLTFPSRSHRCRTMPRE